MYQVLLRIQRRTGLVYPRQATIAAEVVMLRARTAAKTGRVPTAVSVRTIKRAVAELRRAQLIEVQYRRRGLKMFNAYVCQLSGKPLATYLAAMPRHSPAWNRGQRGARSVPCPGSEVSPTQERSVPSARAMWPPYLNSEETELRTTELDDPRAERASPPPSGATAPEPLRGQVLPMVREPKRKHDPTAAAKNRANVDPKRYAEHDLARLGMQRQLWDARLTDLAQAYRRIGSSEAAIAVERELRAQPWIFAYQGRMLRALAAQMPSGWTVAGFLDDVFANWIRWGDEGHEAVGWLCAKQPFPTLGALTSERLMESWRRAVGELRDERAARGRVGPGELPEYQRAFAAELDRLQAERRAAGIPLPAATEALSDESLEAAYAAARNRKR